LDQQQPSFISTYANKYPPKGTIMNYADCIAIAAHGAFENDFDMPSNLLGYIVISEAAMLAGMDSDSIGTSELH